MAGHNASGRRDFNEFCHGHRGCVRCPGWPQQSPALSQPCRCRNARGYSVCPRPSARPQMPRQFDAVGRRGGSKENGHHPVGRGVGKSIPRQYGGKLRPRPYQHSHRLAGMGCQRIFWCSLHLHRGPGTAKDHVAAGNMGAHLCEADGFAQVRRSAVASVPVPPALTARNRAMYPCMPDLPLARRLPASCSARASVAADLRSAWPMSRLPAQNGGTGHDVPVPSRRRG